MKKPRIGISRCLLGDPVRYDGGHKLEPSLTAALGAHVEWVPVCPELEAGMGVPREPLHLVADGAGVRLLAVNSGTDWTAPMNDWAALRLKELAALDLSGFVLKSRSPSCGLRGVPVEGGEGGSGLFASLLIAAIPALPVEEEERLRDPSTLDAFLERVRAYHQNCVSHQPRTYRFPGDSTGG